MVRIDPEKTPTSSHKEKEYEQDRKNFAAGRRAGCWSNLCAGRGSWTERRGGNHPGDSTRDHADPEPAADTAASAAEMGPTPAAAAPPSCTAAAASPARTSAETLTMMRKHQNRRDREIPGRACCLNGSASRHCNRAKRRSNAENNFPSAGTVRRSPL